MTKVKIKNINFNEIKNFKIHDAASGAYKFSLNSDCQLDTYIPCEQSKKHLFNLFPLHLIYDKNQYEIIAGWHWIISIANYESSIPVIVHGEKLKFEEIEEMAWQYVLGAQFQTLNHNSNLAQCVDLIDQMPPAVSEVLFQNHIKKTSQATIQDLAGVTRNVIRNQVKNYGK